MYSPKVGDMILEFSKRTKELTDIGFVIKIEKTYSMKRGTVQHVECFWMDDNDTHIVRLEFDSKRYNDSTDYADSYYHEIVQND